MSLGLSGRHSYVFWSCIPVRNSESDALLLFMYAHTLFMCVCVWAASLCFCAKERLLYTLPLICMYASIRHFSLSNATHYAPYPEAFCFQCFVHFRNDLIKSESDVRQGTRKAARIVRDVNDVRQWLRWPWQRKCRDERDNRTPNIQNIGGGLAQMETKHTSAQAKKIYIYMREKERER